MNVLDQRVMGTEEKVRKTFKESSLLVRSYCRCAHTMFCKIFKGTLENLLEGARGAAEPHSSAPGVDETLTGAWDWDQESSAVLAPPLSS